MHRLYRSDLLEHLANSIAQARGHMWGFGTDVPGDPLRQTIAPGTVWRMLARELLPLMSDAVVSHSYKTVGDVVGPYGLGFTNEDEQWQVAMLLGAGPEVKCIEIAKRLLGLREPLPPLVGC